nr:transposase [Photorhabdus stackebrandtii]
MHAHLIFITKYRGQVFSNEHLTTLEALMRGVCRQFKIELKEFNGELTFTC